MTDPELDALIGAVREKQEDDRAQVAWFKKQAAKATGEARTQIDAYIRRVQEHVKSADSWVEAFEKLKG